MTRKRTDKRAKQAVPEEILAEGSGPNEVVEADAQALADAASEATHRSKRGRKAKQAVDAWGQPVEPVDSDAVSANESEVVAADADADADADANAVEATSEEAPVAKSRKRGRNAKARVAKNGAGGTRVTSASGESDETSASDESMDAGASDESIDADSSSSMNGVGYRWMIRPRASSISAKRLSLRWA